MKATKISGLSQLPILTTPKEQGSMLEGNPSKTGLCEDKNHQDTPTLHNAACSVVTGLVQVEPFLLGACSLPQKALATKADCKFNNAQVDERKHVSTVQPAAPHLSCSLPTSLYSWLLEDNRGPRDTRERRNLDKWRENLFSWSDYSTLHGKKTPSWSQRLSVFRVCCLFE